MNRSDIEKNQAVTSGDCERRHRGIRWLILSYFGMTSLLIVLVGFAVSAGVQASQAAVDAEKVASSVAGELSVHEARQNGSLENIESQLATLKTYHSTIQGELREQRKLLDELLRKSGNSQ